jgi:hypothetical protein
MYQGMHLGMGYSASSGGRAGGRGRQHITPY